MLLSLLPLLLGAGCVVQDPPPEKKELTPAEAAAKISAALKEEDVDAAAAVVDELGHRGAKEVVAAVAPALEHKQPVLRAAALQALRYNPHPGALDALLRVKKSRHIVEDPEQQAAYFYALGQKGDPKALPILTEDSKAAGKKESPVMQARIHALGRIRTQAALEELISMLAATGGRGGRNPFWNDLHLSLQVLAGADHGTEPGDWILWWNDAKKGFAMAKNPPQLPEELAEQWDALWADPYAEDPLESALGGLQQGQGGGKP